MPPVQLTLIRCETLVECCNTRKEIIDSPRVVLSQKCPRLSSVMQIYAAGSLQPFVGRKCKRMSHAYVESWFIGTCWHPGAPAAPKALENFLSAIAAFHHRAPFLSLLEFAPFPSFFFPTFLLWYILLPSSHLISVVARKALLPYLFVAFARTIYMHFWYYVAKIFDRVFGTFFISMLTWDKYWVVST